MSDWLKAGGKLVIASHNDGKVVEIARALAPYHIDVLCAKDFNPPLHEVEETGTTFAENAALKAIGAARESGLVALSDDSGLCVDGLGGAPGIHSARYAVRQVRDTQVRDTQVQDFSWGCQKLLAELENKPKADRSAVFVCVLALAKPDGQVRFFEGRCAGEISLTAQGDKGFGYDPIFIPTGRTQTFGEIAPGEKEKISHRARAFELLVAAEFGR